jgi:hypothetical protein
MAAQERKEGKPFLSGLSLFVFIPDLNKLIPFCIQNDIPASIQAETAKANWHYLITPLAPRTEKNHPA